MKISLDEFVTHLHFTRGKLFVTLSANQYLRFFFSVLSSRVPPLHCRPVFAQDGDDTKEKIQCSQWRFSGFYEMINLDSTGLDWIAVNCIIIELNWIVFSWTLLVICVS